MPAPATVGDVMHAGVVAAHEDAAFKQIVDALVRNGISAVPVIDADRKVVGVVSESDLLARLSGGQLVLPASHLVSAHDEARRKLHATTARELMTAPPVVTQRSTPVAGAAHLAAQARVRRLPVVDADGVLVGIVTRADLLRVFLRPDEEIAEDIRRNVLVGEPSTNPAPIAVEVDDGEVTLHGEVGRRQDAERLVHAVEEVGGVVAIDSARLRWRWDDGRIGWPRARG